MTSFWVYSHNVNGNEKKLKTVLPRGPRITKGKDPVITCLQEVHGDDLAKLISKKTKRKKVAEALNSKTERSKPFVGFKEKKNHYIFWAPDFYQGKQKGYREGMTYLTTFVPKGFFELVSKVPGNQSSKPKVKIYNSHFSRHIISKTIEDLIRKTQNWGERICSAIAVKLKIGGKFLDIFNFHLPAVVAQSHSRAQVLDKVLDPRKDKNKRTIIAGDLNPLFNGERQSLKQKLNEHSISSPFADHEDTYGKKKLDLIGVSKSRIADRNLRLEDYKVLDNFNSDHKRIRAKVTVL